MRTFCFLKQIKREELFGLSSTTVVELGLLCEEVDCWVGSEAR